MLPFPFSPHSETQPQFGMDFSLPAAEVASVYGRWGSGERLEGLINNCQALSKSTGIHFTSRTAKAKKCNLGFGAKRFSR